MKLIRILPLILILLVMAAGCNPAPAREPQLGQVLVTEKFDHPDAWEAYFDDTVDLHVVDGAYRVQTGDAGYIWGLNEQLHTDVVLDVYANQLSAFENNAYGVMCRADPSNNGDGYYFLVSGDGYYSIRKGEGDDVNALVDWQLTSAINGGQSRNHIRAVCIGDYLGLYVNDRFVAETNDSEFTSGYAGFSATAFDGGDTDIAFDDLTIWQAGFAE